MTKSRLKLLSGWLHGLTLACLIALPLIFAGILVALAVGISFAPMPGNAEPSGVFLWLGVIVGFLPALALMWALDLFRRLFARYHSGDVLTEESAALIRRGGQALLLLAALKILVQPLQSVLLTWQAPAGERMVSITIGQAEIGFILVAGLLTVIGWAMTDAARLAEENRSFV